MPTINGLKVIPMATFPLRLREGIADIRLPSRMTQVDADRIIAMIRTLTLPDGEIG